MDRFYILVGMCSDEILDVVECDVFGRFKFVDTFEALQHQTTGSVNIVTSFWHVAENVGDDLPFTKIDGVFCVSPSSTIFTFPKNVGVGTSSSNAGF